MHINKLQIQLTTPEDFLKVKETLTRMGIANNQAQKLYQSCHILSKQGNYYITHFKELLAMDGLTVDISDEDIARRNNIAKMIESWGMITITEPDTHVFTEDNHFRIIGHAVSKEWTLINKYVIR